MNQPDTHAAWQALAASERLEQELEAILVTHHHPDHFGMAAHLAEPLRGAGAHECAGAPGGAGLAAERTVGGSGSRPQRVPQHLGRRF